MSRRPAPMEHWLGYLTQSAVLFAFWLALSDQRRPLFLAIGALSALGVALLTNRLLATVLTRPSGTIGDRLSRAWWFLVFAAWMIWKILAASTQVAYFAIHPGLPFRPGFTRFETTMQRPFSRVVLATAITLVPGTVTVRLDGNRYLVHALLPDAVDDLRSGRTQNMIARFLGEQHEEPPQMSWEPLPEAVR